MRAILEFNLPKDRELHKRCLNGSKYFDAIGCMVEWLKRSAETRDIADRETLEWVCWKVFEICKEHGFSPWEEP